MREYTMLISQNYATTKQPKFCIRKPTNPLLPPRHLKQNHLHVPRKNQRWNIDLCHCLGSKKINQSIHRSHLKYIQYLDIVKKNTIVFFSHASPQHM